MPDSFSDQQSSVSDIIILHLLSQVDCSCGTVSMVWVSNHTSSTITVSITNQTGGSNSNYSVDPAIPYTFAIPERFDNNNWARKGDETLTAQVGGKQVKFTVGKDDHVTIYEDTYQIITAKWGRI
jgi:hypothetical protein